MMISNSNKLKQLEMMPFAESISQTRLASANPDEHTISSSKTTTRVSVLTNSSRIESQKVVNSASLRNAENHLQQSKSGEIFNEMLIDVSRGERLEKKQFLKYACKMEKARLSLIKSLAQKLNSLSILADEYISNIEQGLDQSEIFSFNYVRNSNMDLVQNTDFVQDNAKEFGAKVKALCQKIITTPGNEGAALHCKPDDYQQIIQIHFLPAFLQRVANRVIDSKVTTQQAKQEIDRHLLDMLNSRQIIINGNVRMVAFIVNKYSPNNIPFPDLVQEGTIGLIKAVDRFDYKRPVNFSTYAVYWIRRMISRTIIKQTKPVSLPFNLAAMASAVFAMINKALQENDKWPSTTEIAKSCQLSAKEIESILAFYQPCSSLSDTINGDGDSLTILDTLEQQCFPSPLSELASNNLNAILEGAIKSLPEREAYIIRSRFGINNGIELTLQDIADQFHLSKERVRQIQNSALMTLRKIYGNVLVDFISNKSP